MLTLTPQIIQSKRTAPRGRWLSYFTFLVLLYVHVYESQVQYQRMQNNEQPSQVPVKLSLWRG